MDQQRYLQEKFHGLDANFIKPSNETIEKRDESNQNTTLKALEFTGATIEDTEIMTTTLIGSVFSGEKKVEEKIEQWKKEKSYEEDINYNLEKLKSISDYNQLFTNSVTQESLEATWKAKDGKYYAAVERYTMTTTSNPLASGSSSTTASVSLYLLQLTGATNLTDAEENLTNGTGEVVAVHSSAAKKLQKSISTWYKTLRMIAIVGLLSVLVYVGIRILISSTGQDKAKYKKMLADWVAAMCILFLLQYVMVFTMEMTDKVVGIFDTKNMVSTDENGSPYDSLITTVREKVGDTTDSRDSFAEIFSYIVIYIVLVIYTMVFLWQYLKRVVMLAFLTMIAPLIALTYPLDKIKDGQAQAFSMWIREYVFNALLPVIHTIIYYMLVSSAINFIVDGGNWLYAIVAVGFMMPAEKFFRKMFGFDKASSIGQLGAAAGGAMVMNAINKLGSKSGSGGNSGGSSDIGSGKTKSSTRFIQPPGGNPQPENPQPGNPQPENPQPGNPQPGNPQPGVLNYGETVRTGQPKPAWSVAGVKAGLKGVGKKYINKPNAVKAGKWAGRKFRRAAIGAAGAAALGTFGLAAGIASGDVSKVFQYGGAAALVGAKGANSLGDKLTNIEKQNREEFKENVWGTDEYNMRNSVKELNMDSDFIKTCNQLNLNKDEREDAIRMFHANGITNSEDIKNAMEVRARNGVSQEKIVAATKLHKSLSKSYWGQPKNQNDFKQNLIRQGVTPSEAEEAIKLIGDLKGDLS